MLPSITNSAARVATRALVLSPAIRWRHCRSTPIAAPRSCASVSRTMNSVRVMGNLRNFAISTILQFRSVRCERQSLPVVSQRIETLILYPLEYKAQGSFGLGLLSKEKIKLLVGLTDGTRAPRIGRDMGQG